MPTFQPTIRAMLYGVAIVAAGLSRAGLAQDDLLPGETVRDRARPELDNVGWPISAFRLRPSIDVSAVHDSNVYAVRNDEVSDWLAVISPRLQLTSDWVRHSLELTADGRIARYQDNVDENQEDVRLSGRLELDLTTQSRLGFSALTASEHEDRTSPDDARGFEPTPVDRDRYLAEYAFTGPRKFRLRLRGISETIDFHDVEGIDGIVNHDDRDRTEETAELRLAYEVNEGLDFVFLGRSDNRDYDLPATDPRPNRTSDGEVFGIGLNGTLTGKLFADVIVGKTRRDYQNESFAKIDTAWYSSRIIWNLSGLTSLTFDANRSVWESNIGGASGAIGTVYDLRIDHELLRNLLLYASGSTGTRDYLGIDREDDIERYGLGARYMANRNFQLELDLRKQSRDSVPTEWAGAGFDKSVVSLTARLQF